MVHPEIVSTAINLLSAGKNCEDEDISFDGDIYNAYALDVFRNISTMIVRSLQPWDYIIGKFLSSSCHPGFLFEEIVWILPSLCVQIVKTLPKLCVLFVDFIDVDVLSATQMGIYFHLCIILDLAYFCLELSFDVRIFLAICKYICEYGYIFLWLSQHQYSFLRLCDYNCNICTCNQNSEITGDGVVMVAVQSCHRVSCHVSFTHFLLTFKSGN